MTEVAEHETNIETNFHHCVAVRPQLVQLLAGKAHDEWRVALFPMKMARRISIKQRSLQKLFDVLYEDSRELGIERDVFDDLPTENYDSQWSFQLNRTRQKVFLQSELRASRLEVVYLRNEAFHYISKRLDVLSASIRPSLRANMC